MKKNKNSAAPLKMKGDHPMNHDRQFNPYMRNTIKLRVISWSKVQNHINAYRACTCRVLRVLILIFTAYITSS